ncbi:MAG: hypothetical protein H7A35_09360 [Planctomycetales bacterium]|nr:hypothetical protein [bacterium]UNM07086.1 MAG: hypothetical protein H7A35_09360 [Planctomycetales bacterium]
MTRGLAGIGLGLLALLCAALNLASCGSADATTAPESASLSADAPSFPLDELHYSRQVNAIETLDGTQAFSDCGAPGFAVHETIPTVSVLTSTVEAPTAWAVYRFPLNNPQDLESIKVNLYQGKLDDYYYVMLADYNSNRWHLVGQKLSTSQVLPADWQGLDITSPAKFVYIAVIVVDGRDINIAGLESSITQGNGGDYPIYDDFEDNDTLDTCYPIGVGSYHASTHDDYVPEMLEIGEAQDHWDFYCIDLTAGDHFTATMEYEFINHFTPPYTFNDLDILMYAPGVTSDPLNTFDEQWSSFRIYFTNIELVHFVAPTTGTYRIGIRGDLGDQFTADSNAEYVLNTFISADTHTVSGLISQDEQEPDKKFLVVLTPGNFSAVTSLETAPHGGYQIVGVPDGTYTLEVRGSAGFGQENYTYPNTQQVVVNGGDVNVSLSIDPFPG